ncbi:MAG TPA: hypothetical protein VJR92_14420 [Gemmatimonadaceae bacterium]|nr:hypothetical protein [Gemmatimonadaceae bacterium]
MHRQSSFSDLRERQMVIGALRVAHMNCFSTIRTVDAHDFDFDASAQRLTLHICTPSDEATPICRARQTPIHSRRRHFKHVSLFDNRRSRIEACLNRARRFCAVVDRDLLPVAPINAHVKKRPAPAPTTPKLNKVIAERLKLFHNNEFQRVVHLVSH